MSDITELSIAELSQGFRGKSLSPVDATKAYFARIAKHNDNVVLNIINPRLENTL